MLRLLQQDGELREIAQLVGPDALEEKDRLILEVARMLREVVLGQSAFDPEDAFSTVAKTYRLTALVMELHDRAARAVEQETPLEDLDLPALRHTLSELRGVSGDAFDERADAAERGIRALAPEETS